MVNAQALEATRSADLLTQIAELERQIDEHLRANFEGYEKTIAFSPPVGTKQAVIDAMVSKYREGGWCVTSSSSQRDGDLLEFVAPRPR